MATNETTPPSHFIQDIIAEDQRTQKHGGRVVTRFPPEPNGYLHIGHAKSICLNFGLALENKGVCHLRFDDTNPTKEDVEYVESIQQDVRWLGFDWGDKLFYASDYFDKLYDYAVQLIQAGKAYVCDLNADDMRLYRGTLTEPGKDSPYRHRSVAENLDLFQRMRAGEFAEGSRVLRAKIDMTSGNINMRDPVLYRILHTSHHRTGNTWCIYPMYDFAHTLSDAIEGITHSICTLEFEDHRPLYEWFLDHFPAPSHPQQIEFARLNLTYTVMSKRKLLALVDKGYVKGWDDPRMPTISGLRRRGYTPEAIRMFCERIGVAKRNSTVDLALLEHCLREDLNKRAPRVMTVLNPLKVVIDNYPEGQVETLEAINNPEDASMGTRQVPFSRILYIEQDDFRLDPPKKFSVWPLGVKYVCAMPISSPVLTSSRIRRQERSWKYTVPMTRRRVVAEPRMDGVCRGPCTGSLQPMLCQSKFVYTTIYSANLNRTMTRPAAILRHVSIPIRLRCCLGAGSNQAWRRRYQVSPTSSSGWDIFVPIRTLPQERWCSIGRCRCVIPGPRSHGRKTTKERRTAMIPISVAERLRRFPVSDAGCAMAGRLALPCPRTLHSGLVGRATANSALSLGTVASPSAHHESRAPRQEALQRLARNAGAVAGADAGPEARHQKAVARRGRRAGQA